MTAGARSCWPAGRWADDAGKTTEGVLVALLWGMVLGGGITMLAFRNAGLVLPIALAAGLVASFLWYWLFGLVDGGNMGFLARRRRRKTAEKYPDDVPSGTPGEGRP